MFIKKRSGRNIMAWLLTLVMVASVIMVPAGKVKAASVEVDLNPDTTAKTATADSDNNVKISFEAPPAYDTTDELISAGIDKLQITFKTTSYTASGWPGAMAFFDYDGGWKNQWIDLSQGTEQTVTLDLSAYLTAGSSIASYGLQFANVTGSLSYQIISAKLIGPGVWDVEDNNVSLSYTSQNQYDSYIEYKFTVNNSGNTSVTGNLVIEFDQNREKNWWTEEYSISLSGSTLTISNLTIPANSSSGSIQVQLKPTGASITSVSFAGKGISASGSALSPYDGGSGRSGTDDYDGALTYDVPDDCVDDATTTPVGIHGKLNVNMKTLKIEDQNGNPYQLRGISSHGINWEGNGEYEYEYINYQSIKNCRDILNANAIRLAMYSDEYNGYTTGGSKAKLKYRIDKGVQCATALGMYAIVDWHILNSNPKDNVRFTAAKEFWAYASDRYKDYDNVLYEICNEPTSGIWSDIKSYAETIIPIIRANDPDAIIIVGTPTWSQDVDIAMNDPLKDADGTLMDNVMYTIHFYAATHGESYRNKMKTAWNTIPIFCTEYGMCVSTGDGANDFNSATTWFDMMDEHCISYFVWNLSEKPETSSLITHGSNAYNNWTASNLSQSGQWIKTQYTSRKDVNNTIPTGDIAVTGVKLDKESVSLVVGDNITLKATISPTTATDKELSWSSSKPDVATVDNTGKVTAKKAGTTVITVEAANDKSASCTITVKSALTDINLSKTSITMEKGESLTISDSGTPDILVTPSPSDADLGAISLASDKTAVVSVDNTTGKITASGTGTAKVTVTSGTGSSAKTATLNVTVVLTPTNIELVNEDIDDDTLMLETTGDAHTAELSAKITPDGATVDAADIIWSVKSGDAVSITKDTTDPTKATITALKKGTATVEVAIEGTTLSASCNVMVTVPIESIALDKTELTLITTDDDKNTATLTPIITPEDADGVLVKWTSSDTKIATVSEEGVVTAVGNGTTTITAKVGSKVATCEVTVIDPIQKVIIKDINDEEVSNRIMAIDSSEAMKVQTVPEGATGSDIVEWKIVTGDDVVSIEKQEGTNDIIVKALKKGTATVKVIVGEDIGEGDDKIANTKEATYEITVSNIIKDVNLTDDDGKTSGTIVIGEEVKLNAEFDPNTGVDDPISIEWESDDPSSVSVTELAGTASKEAKVKALKATNGEEVSIKLTVLPKEGALAIVKIYKVRVTKKSQPAPVINNISVDERTNNSIKVSVIPAAEEGTTYEYSFDGGKTWQSSAEIKGLSDATSCTVKVRLAENDENEASSAAATTVKTGTLLTVTDPYTIDVSKLPGGDNYTDDTYMNALYISDKAGEEPVPSATYTDGKLNLLPGRDYKIEGSNANLVISYITDAVSGVSAGNGTVTLGSTNIKSVGTDAAIKINGDATVNGDVKAESVEVEAGTGIVNVAGNVSADNVTIASGTITIDKGITATSDVTITGGTVSITGADGKAAISANKVELAGGAIDATGGSGAAAIEGTENVAILGAVKLSVNSSKNSEGTVEPAISSKAITVEDTVDIKANDSAKAKLFSVIPKDVNGKDVDVTKYTDGANANNTGNNTSGQEQTGNKEQTPQPVKATDMTLTANVKGVSGTGLSGTYQLAIKKTMTVAVSFSPENAVSEAITITSSNPKVVAVSGTKLTAKKAGTAKITVVSENGLTKNFSVKVMKKAVSKVKVKASKKTVKVKKTLKLKALVTPSKKKASTKLYWKSSNESVATVTQKGVVKGIKKGKVKITVTALDGSGKKATVKITVK